MKTDRELLELAAKAAGIKFHAYVDHEIFGTGINIGDVDVPLWNPLTDDGDALRLAVKLRFAVHTPCQLYRAAAQSQDLSRGVIENDGQEGLSDADPFAATRRAIVRAAAELATKETA